MRVLVTFAVDSEFAPWRKLREFTATRNSLLQIHSARIGQTEVDVVLTGVGGKSPWLETAKRVCGGGVDICISSGLAGALKPEYRAGDILVPRAVHSAAWNKVVNPDSELVRLAGDAGATIVESFFSADRVIGQAAEKHVLGRVADAVEMESEEVLFETSAFSAKVIAIRSVSDLSEEDLPLDFNKVVNPVGEVSLPRVLLEVARHPGSVPGLVRFGQQSRMAAEKLCEFLDRYVENLARTFVSSAKGIAAR